jgi:hypothetical protein
LESFAELCQNFPEIEVRLREDTYEYKDDWKQYQINLLKSVWYLTDLPHIIIEELHYKLTLENFELGGKVFHKG